MRPQKKKILLVEDSELDRRILESVLQKKGYTVISLAEGKNCLETVELKQPDIVLLDSMLPDLPGNRLLHLLREKYQAIELPILMTTAKGEPGDIMESLRLGANDYIVKPIDFGVALTRIETQLTIVDQSKELSRLRSLESVAALVVTYNHEINNPLAIAISSLKGLDSLQNQKSFKRLEGSLWRIAEIVKRLKQAIETPELKLEEYGDETKMLKLK